MSCLGFPGQSGSSCLLDTGTWDAFRQARGSACCGGRRSAREGAACDSSKGRCSSQACTGGAAWGVFGGGCSSAARHRAAEGDPPLGLAVQAPPPWGHLGLAYPAQSSPLPLHRLEQVLAPICCRCSLLLDVLAGDSLVCAGPPVMSVLVKVINNLAEFCRYMQCMRARRRTRQCKLRLRGSHRDVLPLFGCLLLHSRNWSSCLL